MSVKFRIKILTENEGRVEVIYFPDDVARNDDGSPKWFAGPYGYDIPTDTNGVPLDGRPAVDWISKQCDEGVIARLRSLYNAPPESKVMPILKAAVANGTEFVVQKPPVESAAASAVDVL